MGMFQIIWSPSITNFITKRDSTYNSSHVDAWLNIVVLDEQLNPVMTNDGNNSYYEQVGNPSTANVKQYNISRPITKSGYVYVYVSDESPNVAAYWDDLQVTHVKGHLLQENGYYPFGLEMKALSSQAALKPQTTYKYNAGTNLESDFDVDYYETPARNYDPQVGRFTEIDALGEQTMSMTTYQFAGNNSIIANDPSGMLKQYQQKPDLSSINLNADPRDINIDMINQMDNFNEGADDMMWAGWEQSGAGGVTENLTDVSQYGGTFQNNGDGTFSFTPFQTEDDAFNWGVNYMTQNNLWGTNGWASSVSDADKKFTTAMGWNGGSNGPWVGVEVIGESLAKGDVYYTKSPIKTMDQQLPNACVPAIMGVLNKIFCGGSMDYLQYMQYYQATYNSNILANGVSFNNVLPFVQHFFNTETMQGSDDFSSFQHAIDAGSPVMLGLFLRSQDNSGSWNGHDVLLIGYNNNTQSIIYLDPQTGYTSRMPQSDPRINPYVYAIPIVGCKP